MTLDGFCLMSMYRNYKYLFRSNLFKFKIFYSLQTAIKRNVKTVELVHLTLLLINSHVLVKLDTLVFIVL